MPALKMVIELNRFNEIAARLRPEVQAIKQRAAKAVEARAQANVHSISGDLAKSIHVEEKGLDVLVVAGEFYGRFVENGHSGGKVPAHPFMKPARDAVLPQWEADLRALEARLR